MTTKNECPRLKSSGNVSIIQGRKSVPTIKDVAKYSGVGVGTISRYLNNKPVTADNLQKIAHSI